MYTTEKFIEKANKLHNFKYNYDKTIFVFNRTPVIITCKIHGDFLQQPCYHLQKQGCKKCGLGKGALIKNETCKNNFLEKVNKIHHNKYDYSLVNYTKAIHKIKIICKEHGIFEQSPNSHLNGNGCNKCAVLSTANKQRHTLSFFIEKSNLIHKNKYNYELVEYKTARKKEKIICPIHGEFDQIANKHLKGQGCIACGHDLINFKKSHWIKKAKDRKGVFYIIKCWNKNEEFYKLGITFNSVKQRYNHSKFMPYNYKIIKEIISENLSYIWDLEKRFKRIKAKQHYTPLISFGGSRYECFK